MFFQFPLLESLPFKTDRLTQKILSTPTLVVLERPAKA
jgi:hypothetical protein